MTLYDLWLIWLVGWVITCLVHCGNRWLVRTYATEFDKRKLEVYKNGFYQYIILLFFWPSYLIPSNDRKK